MGNIEGDTVGQFESRAFMDMEADPELAAEFVRHLEQAGDATTSISVLTDLAASPMKDIRRRVAMNANTPLHLLRSLADDPEVTYAVLRNASAPIEVLRDHSTSDKDVSLRALVGANESTPADVLTTLTFDTDLRVRESVAANPSAPVDLLGRLALEDDEGVRSEVAINPSTPPDLLERLASDATRRVRSSAARGQLPPETLRQLAEDVEPSVREAVASNSVTPAEVLESLAQDSEQAVVWCVWANPSTPSDIRSAIDDALPDGTEVAPSEDSSHPDLGGAGDPAGWALPSPADAAAALEDFLGADAVVDLDALDRLQPRIRDRTGHVVFWWCLSLVTFGLAYWLWATWASRTLRASLRQPPRRLGWPLPAVGYTAFVAMMALDGAARSNVGWFLQLTTLLLGTVAYLAIIVSMCRAGSALAKDLAAVRAALGDDTRPLGIWVWVLAGVTLLPVMLLPVVQVWQVRRLVEARGSAPSAPEPA